MGVSQVISRLCNQFTIEKKQENFEASNLWTLIRKNDNYVNDINKYFSHDEKKTILFIFYELFTDMEYMSLFYDLDPDYLKQLKKYKD